MIFALLAVFSLQSNAQDSDKKEALDLEPVQISSTLEEMMLRAMNTTTE